MKWSAATIRGYAALAGLSGKSKLDVATAVALAESGGNDHAVGKLGERGLWQIYGKAHPQYNSDAMFDPIKNARAMAAISKNGADWTPWTTYNNGAYKGFLDDAGKKTTPKGNVEDSISGIGDAVVPDSISDVPGAIANVAKKPLQLIDWFTDPGNILRIGKVVVGAGMILAGVVIIARPVLSATPVGQAAKIVKKVAA